MVKPHLQLSEFLPYQLSISSNALSDLIARSYSGKFGLKIPEWRVIAVLGERKSTTQRDLVSATAMDKVSVNRASKAMVDRGLIARAPNTADGRSHHLMLTDMGRELYDQIVPLALSIEAELEQALGKEDAKLLADILLKLREQVSRMV
jgi:DNA-binding MarR family transcriptional regulator